MDEELIEFTTEEEIDIAVEESIGWASGDGTYHGNLAGREEPNQHPISSIIDLRAELNEIEALKIVESDKVGIANYYEWKSGIAYDNAGYFVSIIPGTSRIQICQGRDIFGVTVPDAGFIGKQAYQNVQNDDGTYRKVRIDRENNYALVVTSGFVDVRCASDVAVGDYVISDNNGIAIKTTSECGYKVHCVNDKAGVIYASISLGVQADITDVMGQQIKSLDDRMDSAEINIAAAMTVATEAYNKSSELNTSSQITLNDVVNTLEKVDGALEGIKDINGQVESAMVASEQARAIANSAVVTAEAMRDEAINEANKALAEVASDIRGEFDKQITEANANLEQAVSDLEDAKNDFIDTKDEFQNDINDAKKDIELLTKEIEPLAKWPQDSENPTGIAGFVAKANEDSAKIANLVEWKGDTGTSLAGYIQQVGEGYATATQFSQVNDAIAVVKTMAEENKASITALTGVDDSIAGLQAQVDENTFAGCNF